MLKIQKIKKYCDWYANFKIKVLLCPLVIETIFEEKEILWRLNLEAFKCWISREQLLL